MLALVNWGRLSEKSNIPQGESRIRFRPCMGTEYFSLARTFRTVWGDTGQGETVRKVAD